MMQVTIDIVPGGMEEGRRTIHKFYVGNVSGLSDVSDYVVYDKDPRKGTERPVAAVLGHARSDGAVELARKVMRAVEGSPEERSAGLRALMVAA